MREQGRILRIIKDWTAHVLENRDKGRMIANPLYQSDRKKSEAEVRYDGSTPCPLAPEGPIHLVDTRWLS